MRATVIINPIAGPGRSRTIDACIALARTTMGNHGYDADVRVTSAPGDAREYAADALRAGTDLVVAWGGDGTINGAGAAVVGSAVSLGIVPAGSGNGLARDLGLPLQPAEALAVAATGATRVIDAGEVNGSLFFNVAGVGLDARIAGRLAVAGARRGLAGYVQATTAELLRYRAQAYSICIGGGGASEILHETALFIAIANSRQYGVGAQIAPHARLDDGRLELVVVRRQSVMRLIGRLPALFRGTLREGDGLVMRGTTDVQIASDQPVSFHVDGEPGDDAKTLQIRIHPHALSVRVNG